MRDRTTRTKVMQRMNTGIPITIPVRTRIPTLTGTRTNIITIPAPIRTRIPKHTQVILNRRTLTLTHRIARSLRFWASSAERRSLKR